MQKKYVYILSIQLLFAISINAQVNWADDIACILYSNCTNCHNPKGAGPFSLMTYAEASAQSLSIKSATQSKHMPPWTADRTYRNFAHERYLTDDEISLIAQWVDNGVPQGNLANAPTPPVYSSTEVITAPDYRLQIPTYTVSGLGDVYRCFVLDPGTTVTKFLTGLEVIPGNPNIVHHVLFFHDSTSTPATLDAADPGPGYNSYGGTGSTASVLVGAWVPGQTPYFYPSGMGVRIPAGAKLIAQIHYPQGSAGLADSTKFNILMTTSALRNVTIAPALNHGISLTNGPLFIPANTVRTFYSRYTLPAVPITVISCTPHMHLIGRSIKAFAVTPSADTIPLVRINNWDFHWQTQYNYRQPLRLPAGTILYGEATYDNTTNNPFQPSSPPIDVHVGEATTDEMMLIYFGALLTMPGDENIVVDTSTVKTNHSGCSSMHLSLDDISTESFPMHVFPNPASEFITIHSPISLHKIEILDMYGRVVYTKSDNMLINFNIDIHSLSSGTYFIKGTAGSLTHIKKLVIN